MEGIVRSARSTWHTPSFRFTEAKSVCTATVPGAALSAVICFIANRTLGGLPTQAPQGRAAFRNKARHFASVPEAFLGPYSACSCDATSRPREGAKKHVGRRIAERVPGHEAPEGQGRQSSPTKKRPTASHRLVKVIIELRISSRGMRPLSTSTAIGDRCRRSGIAITTCANPPSMVCRKCETLDLY